MSLGELLVIAIVSLLVLKPEDLPKVFRRLKEWKDFIDDTKRSIIEKLDINDNFKEAGDLEKDIGQINFYLAKISALGEEYEGDYALKPIKNYYHTLINRQLADTKSLSND